MIWSKNKDKKGRRRKHIIMEALLSKNTNNNNQNTKKYIKWWHRIRTYIWEETREQEEKGRGEELACWQWQDREPFCNICSTLGILLSPDSRVDMNWLQNQLVGYHVGQFKKICHEVWKEFGAPKFKFSLWPYISNCEKYEEDEEEWYALCFDRTT